uniref:50S ribosomal protein L10 n=1 Tax=Zeugodacus cucurbitae TaxID=28588 RepID=A0A0A1X262_ZEUCU
MFNTFLRVGSRSVFKGLQVPQYEVAAQRLASFTVRNILNETSDETGTLFTRFAKHVAFELQKDAPIVPTMIRYADYFPISDIRYLHRELARLSPDQLPALIVYAVNYRAGADLNKYATLLNELDATAVRLLPRMELDTILRTLYAFLYLMPNWITKIDFYNAAMKHIIAVGIAEDTPKEKFVQICFYLGLEKNRRATNVVSFSNFLKDHLETYLPKLTTLDLIIVANAAFKTSTRIESDTFNSRLIEETLKLSLNDSTNDALLVTLIKAMRFQRIHSKEVCEHLTKYCSEDIVERLQLRGCIHLFAYFADNLWDDENSIESVIDQCFQRIVSSPKFDMHAENVRCKDIATYLWCCAQLNCKLSTSDLQLIESTLLNKVDQNEFKNFVDQLVDSCLSLWSLGYKSRELIEEAVNLKLNARFTNKKDLRDLPKVESRFQVLLSAISIEEPKWQFKNIKGSTEARIDKEAPPYLLKDRQVLVDMSKKIAEHSDVQSTQLVCPISGINIPSILVSYKEPANLRVFVELIPKEQQLRFSKSPIGLIGLKTRLLSSLGYKVITITESQYNEDEISLAFLAHNIEDSEIPKTQSLNV